MSKKKVRVIVLENGKTRLVKVVDSPQAAIKFKRKIEGVTKGLKFEFKFVEDER